MARWSAGGCRPADTVDPRVELSLSLWNGSGPMLVLGKPKTPRQEGKRPRVEHSVYCIGVKSVVWYWGATKKRMPIKRQAAGTVPGARCAGEKCIKNVIGAKSHCFWTVSGGGPRALPCKHRSAIIVICKHLHHCDLQTPPSMYSSNIAFIVICIMWDWWPRIQH